MKLQDIQEARYHRGFPAIILDHDEEDGMYYVEVEIDAPPGWYDNEEHPRVMIGHNHQHALDMMHNVIVACQNEWTKPRKVSVQEFDRIQKEEADYTQTVAEVKQYVEHAAREIQAGKDDGEFFSFYGDVKGLDQYCKSWAKEFRVKGLKKII